MDNSQVAEYVKQLNDKTEYVRRPVSETLGNSGTPALPALMKVLKDKNVGPRWRVQEALAEIGPPAVPALIEALKDEGWHVRWHAALTLREIGDASAAPALIEALKDRDQDVRWAAAEALGEIGDASAVPALIKALKDLKNTVRNDAAIALGKIGDASAIPALVEALKDPGEGVRRCAVEGLQKIGDSQTLPRKILASSQFSAQERIEVLEALRCIRYQDRYPTLVKYPTLRYTFPDTRTLCQTVLKENDAAATAEAQVILDWLDGDHHLAIVSQSGAASDPQEVHRAAQAGSPLYPRPETSLRGTDVPREDTQQSSQPRTFRERLGTLWGRLFAKRKSGVK